MPPFTGGALYVRRRAKSIFNAETKGGAVHFSAEDAAGLTEILRWRRDVRHFRPTPLEAATLARLQAAVDLSPSVGNSRPWRFLRVRSPALRLRVAEIFERANAEAAAGYEVNAREEYFALKLAGLR